MTHCLVPMATVSRRRLLTSHDAQKKTLQLHLYWEDLRMLRCVCMYVHLCVIMYVCVYMCIYLHMYVHV